MPFYDADYTELDELDEDFDDPEFLEDEPPYDGPRCAGCGCSEDDPCEGGCVWASANLCSRCIR
jgi:hypothetical protein